MEKEYDHLTKITIAGDSGTGKTNILSRYLSDKFNDDHIPTIGVEFGTKIINTGSYKVKQQIWDCAGQERYRALTKSYYKGAVQIILLYSINARQSFENIKTWMKEIESCDNQNTQVFLVGNKSDLEFERKVTYSEGEQMAKEFNLKFYEVSAKLATNIQEFFSNIAQEYVQQINK